MEFPQLDDLSTEEQQSDVVADAGAKAEKVCFVGVGQAGCKIADAFWAKGYRRVLLLNTTEQDMAGLECPNRVIMQGAGHGAGKNRAVGKAAAEASREEILRAMFKAFGTDFERVVVCTSGGGGTGSGASPTVVQIARTYCDAHQKPQKVGAIVGGPRRSEGQAVGSNNSALVTEMLAEVSAKRLSPLVLMDNERIAKLYPKASVADFFRIANANVVGLYDVFNSLAAQSSAYSTLDPADYRSVMDAGVLVFGMTTVKDASDPTAIAAAVEKNIGGGLLSDAVTIRGATHAAGIMVTSKERLASLPQADLDRAFESLNRVIGTPYLCVHQGVYETDTVGDKVLFYCCASGLKWAP